MKSLFHFVKKKLISLAPKNDHPSRMLFHFYYGMHNRLLKYYRGEFEATVHGATMSMPSEHLLPVYVGMNQLQETPLIEVANAVVEREGVLNMIDIGANIGDTVLFVDKHARLDNAIAIEGSDHFFPYLQKNVNRLADPPKVKLEKIYLAEESGQKKVVRSEDYGTGSLTEDSNGQTMFLQTLDDLVQSKYSNVQWNLVKLDTDGFDYRILKGASNILSTNVDLFFEYDPMTYKSQGLDPAVIFSYLKPFGYQRAVLFNNWGEKMYDGPLDVNGLIGHLVEYNLQYHRFHFDVWASKKNK